MSPRTARGCLRSALLAVLIAGCDLSSPETVSQPVGAAGAGSASASLSTANRSPASPAITPVADEEASGPPWFTNVVAESGVDFRHLSGESPEKPFPSANGSGAAIFDFDRDGLADLYFATGAPFPIDLARTDLSNRLYRNLGQWRFAEATLPAAAGHNGFSAGLAVGDYDADGFADLFVACYGADCLLHNLGDGTFERVENEAQLADDRWGASAAFLDYDDDGLLDLYVCNYAEWTWEKNPFCGDAVRNIRMHCGPRSVEPAPHFLYRNRGDGAFERAETAAGVGERRGRGQGVLAADLTGDGRVDLYVANDLNPNFLYINEGGGRFKDLTDISGAAFDALGNEQAGMGLDAADINGDGLPELFVTNFALEYNTLYENQGDNFFSDVSNRYGLIADSLPHVGWGTSFSDFDLDGALDLVVTNGHVDDNRHKIVENSSYFQPPLLYRGERGRFAPIHREGGPYFRESHVGRGLAVGDLDNDGDEDVVIVHQDAAPALLRNERLQPATGGEAPYRPSLSLRLVGRNCNRDALGASITFAPRAGSPDESAGQPGTSTTLRLVKGGGSYLSTSDTRIVYAAAESPSGATPSRAVSARIVWPGGEESFIDELQFGREYVILEGSADVKCVVIASSIDR